MAVNKKIVSIDTDQAQSSVRDLRQLLKQLKDQMVLTTAGTEEYNAAMRQAAEIQHLLRDQMELVNNSALDAGQIFKNATTAVRGMVAGFLAVRASMNLMGILNENVIKSLEQMQNLMSLTQALPAIEAGRKAFLRLGNVIKLNVAALKSFSAATIATGIGAIIAAVGLLAANWESVAKWLGITTSEQKKLNQELNDKALENYTDTLGRRIRLEERLAAIMGAQDSTAKEAGLKVLLEEKGYLDKVAEAYENLSKAQEEQTSAQRRTALVSDQYGNSTTYLNDELIKAQENTKNARKAFEEAVQSLRDFSGEQDIIIRNADDLNGLINKNSDEIRKTTKDIEDLRKIEEAERKAAAERAKQDELEKRLEAERKAAKDLAALLEDTRVSLLKIIDPDYKAPKSEWEIDIELKPEIVEENEEAVEDDVQKYIDEVAKKYLEKLNAAMSVVESLRKAFQTPQEQYEEEQAALDLALEKKKISQEEYYKLSIKLAEEYKLKQTELAMTAVDAWATALSSLSLVFSSTAELIDRSTEEGEEKYRTMMYVSTMISMLAGVMNAVTSAFSPANAWMTIYGQIAMAAVTSSAVIASGIAQMSQIKKANSNTSAASSAPSTGALQSLVAPVLYTQDVQGASIEGAIKDTKVYVTESDISNTQKRVNVAESEARF